MKRGLNTDVCSVFDPWLLLMIRVIRVIRGLYFAFHFRLHRSRLINAKAVP